MAVERTLSIIKPDAVAKNVIGEIYTRFERAGLRIVAARMMQLSRADAEGFYAVHKERAFFKDLVDFMTSGPVMIQVLEGESAIQKNRDLMGATDPKKAATRALFAPISLKASTRTRCTARIRPRTPPSKSRIFFQRSTSARARRVNVMVNLLGLSPVELQAFCAALGEKPYRAKQLLRWIHQAGADDFGAMTDISKALREELARTATIAAPGVRRDTTAADGTRKWLLDVGTGNAIETVFIPGDRHAARSASRRRRVARSSARSARPAGRVSTAISPSPRSSGSCGSPIARWGAASTVERPITNVVMMGMGEPLANFDNVVAAMQLMLDDSAYGLSRRRVTLSTSGLVPAIDRLRDACPVALAVSLHAPNDELRNELVPINRKYPIRELLAACVRYIEKAPRDFVTFEYVMLDGVNDSAGPRARARAAWSPTCRAR